MSGEGSGTGSFLAGTFLFLAGGCLTLVGGGCAIVWLALIFDSPREFAGGAALLLLFVGMAAAGIVLIRSAFRAFRGPPSAPPRADIPE